MGKIILVFFVVLACLYPVASEKDLPNGLMKHPIDGRHLPEREDSSDSKIRENISGSARKLFGLAYRSTDAEIPQLRKVRFQKALIYCALI